MDGDGYLDLVESSELSDINIFYNNSFARYFEESSLSFYSGTDTISNLQLIDIDNDGDTDIIFSDSESGSAWVYYNSLTGDQ